MKYGEKSLKDYNAPKSLPELWSLGILMGRVEFWSNKYDISIQFWGTGNVNVFIENGSVELYSFGGCETILDAAIEIIRWCEKANPRVKYPTFLAPPSGDIVDD
jgi:hypothetical protein